MSQSTANTTGWTNDELDRIDTSEELRIASLRADGTLRNQVTIWVVRDGSDLYVVDQRARRPVVPGHAGSASRSRLGRRRRKGRLEDANRALDDRLDAAYRT